MSRNYLEAFTILIITFALGFFLVLPKYQESQDIKRQVEEKKNEIKNRAEYYAGLDAIMADLKYYQENMQKVNTAIPDNLDVAATMNFAQAAAMQAGLAVKGIEHSGAAAVHLPASGEPVLGKYIISIKLAGGYGNFKNFLSIIEHSSRLIAVESVSVRADQEKEEEQGQNERVKTIAQEESEEIIGFEVKLSANYYKGSVAK